MKLIIPCFYTTYGRYITRFRSNPYYIDALKPVERRCLLSLYETARNKLVKAAKVVGNLIANYHPHGDLSGYGSLVKLVENNYAIGEGNWGSRSLTDDSPAAMRYTECKLNPWVENLAFQYIKHVPWCNLEYEDEPLSLPSPIPIGLIGYDIITGISFYKTVIPKYSLSDLAKRLEWLLSNPGSTEDGPIIKPNFRDCQPKEINDGDFLNILRIGVGSIQAVPYGKFDQKKNEIHILGRAPNSNFNTLKDAATDIKPDTKKPELEIDIDDASGNMDDRYSIDIYIKPLKKNIDMNSLISTIWTNYLIRNINFNCYFSDDNGNLQLLGIDQVLLNNYDFWKKAVLSKRWKEYYKTIENKFNNNIILIVRNIITTNNCQTITQVLNIYKSQGEQKIQLEIFDQDTNNWYYKDYPITEKEIVEVCSKKSIKQLIEQSIDLPTIDQELVNKKTEINNIDTDCYQIIKNLI